MARLDAHHGRSRSAAAAVGNTAAAQHRMMLTDRKKPSYKVVIEQIQQKKELITQGTHSATPPRGYTFIPAGDPQVTNRCKELALTDRVKVYIVSTSRPNPQALLAKHVHRIGYHFPSYIVGLACSTLEVQLNKHGRVAHQHEGPDLDPQRARKMGKVAQVTEVTASNPELTQAAIDTQARDAIKDLFPNIPEKDMHEVVRRAFEKGKNLVGTSFELSLQRRVQLAVVAHIRHVYTDYDKLLKEVDWAMARRLVEQSSLNVVAKWIKEVHNAEAYEDILREVIVIPDDDEDDEVPPTARDQIQQAAAHHHSPGHVPRPRGKDENQARLPDHVARQISPSRYKSPDALEGDGPASRGQYILQPSQRDPLKAQKIGIRRHQLWEQALDRRMKEPETYRIIREAPREHPPLALRTIEAHRQSNRLAHASQSQGHHAPQQTQSSTFQPPVYPKPALRVVPVQSQVPQIQYSTLAEKRDFQDRPIATRPLRTEVQSLSTSTPFNMSYHADDPPKRVLPYQSIDQRLVSSHQSLHDPSKQNHPYFQSGFVEKIVPSIEDSQGNGQSENMTAMQRHLQTYFTTQNPRKEKEVPHRQALQRVASYTDDHVNPAKRRRTDDVHLQDHSFWRSEQRQPPQERLALVPFKERDRQVEYIDYSDIRQHAGETRLVPIEESVPSHRQSLVFREQGNSERFSSNHQERIVIRSVQAPEAHRQASRTSASFVPVPFYSSETALRMPQTVPLEKASVLQQSDRPVEHARHDRPQPGSANDRPPESQSLKRWEDPRREVIVLDSPPEPQRSLRAMPPHEDPSRPSRGVPASSLQTQGNHYESKPTNHLSLAKGTEARNRIVLQNGETLHRYQKVAEPTFRTKQEANPVLVQQESCVISSRRENVQNQSSGRLYDPLPQQRGTPDTSHGGRWPPQQEPPLRARTLYQPEADPQQAATEPSRTTYYLAPPTERGRRVFDARTGREIIVLE